MSVDHSDRARLRPGEAILFIDRKEREYLRVLRPGSRLHIRDGTMQSDNLIGMLEGSTVYNSASEPFLMVRPTFASLVPNLPRRAQVIYPKDIGPILLWGDIGPGMRVIEVGAGPGALTMALLRAVGPSGQVVSYETRSDFYEMAQSNVRQFFGDAPNWNLKLADATAVSLRAPGAMRPNRRRQRGTFIARICTDAGGAGHLSGAAARACQRSRVAARDTRERPGYLANPDLVRSGGARPSRRERSRIARHPARHARGRHR